MFINNPVVQTILIVIAASLAGVVVHHYVIHQQWLSNVAMCALVAYILPASNRNARRKPKDGKLSWLPRSSY